MLTFLGLLKTVYTGQCPQQDGMSQSVGTDFLSEVQGKNDYINDNW